MGYGAPANFTTILNFCDINFRLVDKIFDNSATKIGKYTPGKSLIKIENSDKFKKHTVIIVCYLHGTTKKKFCLKKNII